MEYSIGEFAALLDVTVKTLHHYEKINLLMPARVDAVTGYRKYRAEQLTTMTRIREYRELGLSLTAIKRVIVENVDDDTLKSILQSRLDSLQNRIAKDLQTYRALAEKVDTEDDPPRFIPYFPAVPELIAESCLPMPPPGVRGPLDPDLELGEHRYAPNQSLLCVSTTLASRSVGHLKRATQFLAEKLLPQSTCEELKYQIWYWIEVADDPEEAPFRMYAGLEESKLFPNRPELRKVTFADSPVAFTGHQFSAFGPGHWKRMTQHVHYEMFARKALPLGPLFVQFDDRARGWQGSVAYQRGVIDQSSCQSPYSGDPFDDDAPYNPFAHWYQEQ